MSFFYIFPMFSHKKHYLVGGLEHGFYDFPDIGNKNPKWQKNVL